MIASMRARWSLADEGEVTLSPSATRRALVALRLILGSTAYATPDLAARAFGIDPDEGTALPSAVRLFGAREFAMGVALAVASGPELRRWLAIGAVVDGLDVVTVVLGGRAGRIGKTTIAVGGGLASVAVGLGLASLREDVTRRGGAGPATSAAS